MKRKPTDKNRGKGLGDGAIIMFFLVLVIFIVFSYGNDSVRQDQKILLSTLVIEHEAENGPAIVVGNIVDVDRFKKISATSYSDLKSLFGIESEFIIYFEDVDGNVIEVDDTICIGSSYGQVNGHRCS